MQIISIELDILNYVFEHKFEFDVKKIVKELKLHECWRVFSQIASHFNIVRDLTKMRKACQHSCNISLTTKCFSLQHRARHCKQKYFRKWLRKQHPAVCLPLSDEGWCAVDCLTLQGRLLGMLWFIDYLDFFSSLKWAVCEKLKSVF